MAIHPLQDGPAPDIARLIQAAGLVLVVTEDSRDKRHAAVRAAATQLAHAAGANVLLFYARPDDAGRSASQPRPFDPLAGAGVGANADVGAARPHTGTCRRNLLRDQAAEIRSEGPHVQVWLSRLVGPAGITKAVVTTGATVVFVPADPERTGVGGRAIRLTLAYYAARIPVPLVTVDTEGRIAIAAPLGSTPPVAGSRAAVARRSVACSPRATTAVWSRQ